MRSNVFLLHDKIESIEGIYPQQRFTSQSLPPTNKRPSSASVKKKKKNDPDMKTKRKQPRPRAKETKASQTHVIEIKHQKQCGNRCKTQNNTDDCCRARSMFFFGGRVKQPSCVMSTGNFFMELWHDHAAQTDDSSTAEDMPCPLFVTETNPCSATTSRLFTISASHLWDRDRWCVAPVALTMCRPSASH